MRVLLGLYTGKTHHLGDCTPTDRQSVHNRCVIEHFGSVFVLSIYFFEFSSAGIGDFVIELIQISYFLKMFSS